MSEVDLVWGKKPDDDEEKLTQGEVPLVSHKKEKKRKISSSNDKVCLHCSASGTTTRQDIKCLFFSYKAKNIKIMKAKNKSAQYHALVEVPNIAMALHAIKTFNNTNQEAVVGYDRSFQVSVNRSRTENKKRRFTSMKSKSIDAK